MSANVDDAMVLVTSAGESGGTGKTNGANEANGIGTRHPSFASMVKALVKAHRASYAVLCVATALASVLTSMLLQILGSALARDGEPDLTGMSMYQRIVVDGDYTSAIMLAGISAGCCILVAVFLTLSSVSFLVQERRREYGLMRLAGLSRRRAITLALGEFSVPLVLSTALGTALSMPLVTPVGRFFAYASQ